MTFLELASVSTLATVLLVLFLLGAAPVYAIRLISLLYPKGDPRRAELVAEIAHVKGLGKMLELWRWLGESFAVATCEGLPARRAARRRGDDVLIGPIQVWAEFEGKLTKLHGPLDDPESIGPREKWREIELVPLNDAAKHLNVRFKREAD